MKNSKIKGRFPSKTVTKWLRTFGIKSYSASRKEVIYFKRIQKLYDLEEILKPIKQAEIKSYPLLLGMHFVRNSKHKWDFNNANQIILDLMTALDIIPDDNTQFILPFPLLINDKYWDYDKENPGVYIKLL